MSLSQCSGSLKSKTPNPSRIKQSIEYEIGPWVSGSLKFRVSGLRLKDSSGVFLRVLGLEGFGVMVVLPANRFQEHEVKVSELCAFQTSLT